MVSPVMVTVVGPELGAAGGAVGWAGATVGGTGVLVGMGGAVGATAGAAVGAVVCGALSGEAGGIGSSPEHAAAATSAAIDTTSQMARRMTGRRKLLDGFNVRDQRADFFSRNRLRVECQHDRIEALDDLRLRGTN